MSDRILIVDSDCLACELLQFKFEDEGFKVDVEHDCNAAMQRPLSDYNLLLVDMMESDFDGIRFTRMVRDNSETANLPIILLTAKASEDNIVSGLDAGADDFIQKPFSTRELVARIRSVLRRRRVMSARRMSNIMRYRGLSVDFGTGIVTVDGAPLMLTRTEYLILAMFLRHRNQFFERAEIQHEAWEEDGISERAVDTNISRLRKKLGEYGRNIINRQGFGYGFIE
ncbi:MAG: response regulator transcription factor [Paramuribaculum sp.]|nr:response regulator transcription factor [Paramuribaculum sp.]